MKARRVRQSGLRSLAYQDTPVNKTLKVEHGDMALAIFRLVFFAAITIAVPLRLAHGQASTPPPLANIKPLISNLVPDKKTAITIALAVLTPIYGERQIRFESPFHAKLNESIWYVEGTLPAGHVGGIASIKISRDDARIISILHGQ